MSALSLISGVVMAKQLVMDQMFYTRLLIVGPFESDTNLLRQTYGERFFKFSRQLKLSKEMQVSSQPVQHTYDTKSNLMI